jgi:nucleoside-diphosphate-sugar epimerase
MKDFVNFELAKKLKEKGYLQAKKDTLAMYNDEGDWFSLATNLDKDEYSFEDFDNRDYICPTIAQVLAWLREEHKLHVCINLDSNKNWFYSIEGITGNTDITDTHDYFSYEEAAISGICYALDTLIK